MRSFIILLMIVAILVSITSATVIVGTVLSTLGLALLPIVAVIALVIAATGRKNPHEDDVP